MPGPALARDVVAAGDVDHEDLHVGERRAEDRGEVVAAALDEDEVERALAALELVDRLEVRRDVVADRRVRAAAGLDREDPVGRQHAGAAQELRVLGRVDVVRDDADARARRRASGRARRRASSCPSRPGRRCRSAARAQDGKEPPSSRRRGRASAARARARSRPAARAGRPATGAAASSAIERLRLDQPACGLGRVDRQQPDRGGRDRGRVLVEVGLRDGVVARGRRPRRRRRTRPAAASPRSPRGSAAHRVVVPDDRGAAKQLRAEPRRGGAQRRARAARLRLGVERGAARRRRRGARSRDGERALRRRDAAQPCRRRNAGTRVDAEPASTAASSPPECA